MASHLFVLSIGIRWAREYLHRQGHHLLPGLELHKNLGVEGQVLLIPLLFFLLFGFICKRFRLIACANAPAVSVSSVLCHARKNHYPFVVFGFNTPL